jgi:HEAT repeat protein
MQYRAARAAYKLAEASRADIAALVPVLVPHVTESNYLDSEAGRALAAAGPQGIEALLGMLTHSDARVRERAVHSLTLVRDKPGVLEAFLRMVDDPDRNVRFAALAGLSGRVKTDPNAAVPIGLRFVEKLDSYERWAGARLLAAYADDPRAEEALRSCLEDPDENVRRTAERALSEARKRRGAPGAGP